MDINGTKKMNRNKLSFTSTSMYSECPKKFFLHYRENLRPIQERSPLYFGRCLDNAFNVLLLRRNLEDALDNFDLEWAKAPANLSYSKSDLDLDLSDNPHDCLHKKGKIIIQTYYEKVLPKIKKVITVQRPISLKNSDGDEVAGILDLIVEWEDGKTYLMDNKSSSVEYTPTSAKESNQLVLYYYIEKDNLKLDGVGFIVISKKLNKIKTCTKCNKDKVGKERTCTIMYNNERCNGEFKLIKKPTANAQVIINQVEEKDEDRCIEMFDSANNGIINQNYEPNYKSCFGKFGPCVFNSYCHKNSMDGLFKKEDKK